MNRLRLLGGFWLLLISLLLTGCLPIPVIETGAEPLRAGQAFTADGSGSIVSNVPAGTVAVSHRWDFGDGTQRRGERVTHTYLAAGIYIIRLTVVDSAGRNADTELSVTVLPALPRAPESSDETSGSTSNPAPDPS